jgi:hypothetical protein
MAKDTTAAVKPAAKDTPPAAPPKAAAKTVPGIRVVAKRDGFRRAGYAWSKAGTDMPLKGIPKDVLKQLRDEPVLTVTDIEFPAAEASE